MLKYISFSRGSCTRTGSKYCGLYQGSAHRTKLSKQKAARRLIRLRLAAG
jgi:hypothetical protein